MMQGESKISPNPIIFINLKSDKETRLPVKNKKVMTCFTNVMTRC